MDKRRALTERLIQALEPMTTAQAVSELATFYSLERLENVTKFEEGRP